ncbi:MAG: TetR/AcrR family transcriptional regulator [Myxococcota bacterium]|nr:TetR/AcrR family transcriptional regulator [Myxococcota bacterium]
MAGRGAAADPGHSGSLDRVTRSRLAICDACLDLIQEGVLQPSADQISDRAGLSRRSIFYHFKDLSELYDAVVEVGMQRCAPLLKEIPRELPVAERVAAFVDARGRFFEATAPFTRALTAQVLVGAASGEAWRVSREGLEAQRADIEALLASELGTLALRERTELVDAMAAAINAPSWEYLRRSRGLSMARARGVLDRTVRALLEDAGIATS